MHKNVRPTKGKVQLLRLQANKSRRDSLAKFDSDVSLALARGIGAGSAAASATATSTAPAAAAAAAASVDSASNLDPPLFVVFDWVAFSRKLRQQYYDRLKADFPGEFIYISASDDFASLQGSISKSGCSVLYDVDDKTSGAQSRTEILAGAGAAFAGFFLQPEVRCVFFTQDFAAERESLDIGFVHSTVDAAELPPLAATPGELEGGGGSSSSSSSSTTTTTTTTTTSGGPETGGDDRRGATDSVLAAHSAGKLSLAFYVGGVLRTLLRRPLLYAEHCCVSGFSVRATVALEGPRCFVFFDGQGGPGCSGGDGSSGDGAGGEAAALQQGAIYCCVADAHLVNVWLALLFAEQVEAADAAAAEAKARATDKKRKKKAMHDADDGLFLTGGGAADTEAEDEGDGGDGATAAALQQQLAAEPWYRRVPQLFSFSMDDQDGGRAIALHLRNMDQLPPDAYQVRRQQQDGFHLVSITAVTAKQLEP